MPEEYLIFNIHFKAGFFSILWFGEKSIIPVVKMSPAITAIAIIINTGAHKIKCLRTMKSLTGISNELFTVFTVMGDSFGFLNGTICWNAKYLNGNVRVCHISLRTTATRFGEVLTTYHLKTICTKGQNKSNRIELNHRISCGSESALLKGTKAVNFI